MVKTPSSTQLGDFCNLVKSGQVIFFVGSRVSLSYPACLPSAQKLLDFSLSHWLPQVYPLQLSREEKQELLEKFWPEVFYQDLMALIGDSALDPFMILAYPGAKPTLAHYLIVKVSASAGVPIITTNFDCLLECAAERLKFGPKAIGPSGPYWPQVAKCLIWKVHGSIKAGKQEALPSDLLATVSRITQPNVQLLNELRALFRERHVCFVGYSRSDLDLFPMIRGFSDIKTPFWVDTYASDRLKSRSNSIGAILISSTLEEVFVGERLRSLADFEADGVSITEFQPLENSDNKLRTEIAEELSRIGKEQLRQYSLSQEQQRLLLAIILHRFGKHIAALKQLETHYAELDSGLDRKDQALLLVTMARLYDCISDYKRSESFAQAALNTSKWRRLISLNPKPISLRVQSLHALSIAKKMQLGPSFTYGVPEVDFVPSPARSVQVLLRYVWTALRMKFLLSLLRNSARSDSKAKIWILSGWHWYLDHKIVLLALIKAALERFPKLRCVAEKWILDFLHQAEIQASNRGNAQILAHVQKELQRHGFHSAADLDLAFDAYDLTTDPLNQALVHRNRGDSYLKDGRKNDAIVEFEKMLKLAEQCSSKATVLKALVGLHVSGKKVRKVDLNKIQGLSGSGYEHYVSKFRRVLD